jgi:DNA-binding transcriptional regulator YhcF (GntR family)
MTKPLHTSSVGMQAWALYANVLARILTGEVPGGSMLEPVRKIAERYGVDAGTVQKAYRRMQEEGWVCSSPRGGRKIVVEGHVLPAEVMEAAARFSDVVASHGVSATHATLAFESCYRLDPERSAGEGDELSTRSESTFLAARSRNSRVEPNGEPTHASAPQAPSGDSSHDQRGDDAPMPFGRRAGEPLEHPSEVVGSPPADQTPRDEEEGKEKQKLIRLQAGQAENEYTEYVEREQRLSTPVPLSSTISPIVTDEDLEYFAVAYPAAFRPLITANE